MAPLGILSTGLAPAFMITLVGQIGGPRGAIATYFVPVVAILLGGVVLGESITLVSIVGTALVLLGAGLASRAEPAARS